jgi:hypothetical protein
LKEKAAAGGIRSLAQYMENFETWGKNHPIHFLSEQPPAESWWHKKLAD